MVVESPDVWEPILSVISGLASLGTIATGVVAILALIRARKELDQARRIHVAEARPYVVPTLVEGITESGHPAIYLRLENHGRTPALEVRLDFFTDEPYSMTSSPLPFLRSEAGINLIAPGSSLEVFLGRKTKSARFLNTLANGVEVEVRCRSAVNTNDHSDRYVLTLRDKYARRNESQKPPATAFIKPATKGLE